MATINYDDKVALNVNSSIADINKVNASDMNEIKQVVNENANTLDNKISNAYGTSQTNGYSQEYVNSLTTYSTTEQRVGTWINGKPLYRKVFTDSSTTSGDHEINISSINHDYISLVDWNMISRGFCLKNFGADGNSTYANSFINSLDKKIIWTTGTYWADCSYVAIVEYTKTTD